MREVDTDNPVIWPSCCYNTGTKKTLIFICIKLDYWLIVTCRAQCRGYNLRTTIPVSTVMCLHWLKSILLSIYNWTLLKFANSRKKAPVIDKAIANSTDDTYKENWRSIETECINLEVMENRKSRNTPNAKPKHGYNREGGGEIMNEWKRHKFLLLFSGTKTHDYCIWATEVGKNLRVFFISFTILVHVPDREQRYKDPKRRCKCTLNPQNNVQKPGFLNWTHSYSPVWYIGTSCWT